MGEARDPLEGIERVLVDGNNLLGAMRRGAGGAGGAGGVGGAGGGPLPAAALIGRLRAVIPPAVRIELVFDGPPDPGGGNVRVATGVTVRYSGRISADALLVRLVTEAAPFTIDHAATILVVTDDTALGTELRRRGALTARTAWLIRKLERSHVGVAVPSASGRPGRPGRPVGLGHGRPPRGPGGVGGPGGAGGAGAGDDDDRPGWRPGRGATAKKGNAARRPRRSRDGC